MLRPIPTPSVATMPKAIANNNNKSHTRLEIPIDYARDPTPPEVPNALQPKAVSIPPFCGD